jgi:hypothetical protein
MSSIAPLEDNKERKSVNPDLLKPFQQSGSKKSSSEDVANTPVPYFVTDSCIGHEVWEGDIKNPNVRPKFAIKYARKTEIEYVDSFETGCHDEQGRRIVYVPLYNDQLKKGTVILPRRATKCTLREAIGDVFRYLTDKEHFDSCARENWVKLLGLVCIGSWFLDKVASRIAGMGAFAPIIAIRGPSGSGKNRLANLLRMVSPRPYFDISKPNTPSLFRPLSVWKGTLIMDECDLRDTTETSSLIKYLNSRATGTPIAVVNPENLEKQNSFYNFGVTIVTQRGYFEDNATESRTIPFLAEKTDNPRDIPSMEEESTIEEGLNLQDKLLYIWLTNFRDFDIDRKEWIGNLTDSRLNSGLLPAWNLINKDPELQELKDAVLDLVLDIEREKIINKKDSPDGVVVNSLWEKISSEGFAKHNNLYYLAREKDEPYTIGTGTEMRIETRLKEEPITSKEVANSIGWKGGGGVRAIVKRLHISPKEAPDSFKFNDKTYKGIFFEPKKLEKLFRDFVVDYPPNGLKRALNGEKVTEVTVVTPLERGGIVKNNKEIEVKSHLTTPPPLEIVTSGTTVTAANRINTEEIPQNIEPRNGICCYCGLETSIAHTLKSMPVCKDCLGKSGWEGQIQNG